MRITGRTANRIHLQHAAALRALEQAVGELTPQEIDELRRFLADPAVVEWFSVRAQIAARVYAGEFPFNSPDYDALVRRYYHTKGTIVTVDLPAPTPRTT
jgi:hypothetical protein